MSEPNETTTPEVSRQIILLGGPRHEGRGEAYADTIEVEGETYAWDGNEPEEGMRARYLHEGRPPEATLTITVEYGRGVRVPGDDGETANVYVGHVDELQLQLTPDYASGVIDVLDQALRPGIARAVNSLLDEIQRSQYSGDGSAHIIVPPGS